MESGPVCRSSNRPRMLICYLCGREYGSRSLSIHIPQCQRKWLLEEDSKPKNERRPLPSQPNAEKAIRDGGGRAYDNFNAEAYAAFEQTLTQCPNCQRRFNPKSFHKHQRGCTTARPAKPAGTGLIKYSLTNRLVPGAVAGSMHGKATTQPLPLCLCRPPKLKLNSKNPPVRPAWTAGNESRTDDKQSNATLLRYKRSPGAQELCLHSETHLSSNQAANTGHRMNKNTSSFVRGFRNRPPDLRTSSPRYRNGGHRGGDDSHLVNTFGDLWKTHKECNSPPPPPNRNSAQDWCAQGETWITPLHIGNPRLKSSLGFHSRQSTSSLPMSQIYQNERALELVGVTKIFPSSRDVHYGNYVPKHGK